MFTVCINDVFAVRGQGLVLAGCVENGRVAAGERAILRTANASIPTVVVGIEQARNAIAFASAGEEVALLVRWIDPNELRGSLEPIAGIPGTW